MNCPHCSRALTETKTGHLYCTACRATFSEAAARTETAPTTRAQERDRILVLDYTKRKGHA